MCYLSDSSLSIFLQEALDEESERSYDGYVQKLVRQDEEIWSWGPIKRIVDRSMEEQRT